jgi:AAA domain
MPNMAGCLIDHLYVMMKGEPGLRKSTQALSFPGPQYWFSWDRKMDSIILPMKKWGIDPKTISYDDYDDWTAGKKKLEQLQVNCPYKTIVIDSITSMADMTLRQTMRIKYGTTKGSGAAAGKLVAGIAVNEIEDYNAESSALQELIALTKDIHNFHKVNIILIAHVVKAEYRDTTKKTTHISRQIVTAGKNVAAKIPAYCGEVYHFNIKQGFIEGAGGDYSLLTTHTGDDFARTALELDKEIVFGDKPIYDTYIRPAITKLNATNNVVAKF